MTLYEKTQYILKQTQKPKYLDFYDLDKKDLTMPEIYIGETIRLENKWFFLEVKKKYFNSEKERDEAPTTLIKELYKKPTALNN